MFKKDFQRILNDEMEFYGKRFTGNGATEQERESDRKRQYMRVIERYYESLAHLSESALSSAFKKCREHYEYFPKINQLLKFTSPKREEEKQAKPVYTQPTPEVKAKIQSALKRSRYKVGKTALENNMAFCKARWPMSNWNGVLERWLEEDGFREERPAAT